MAGEWIKMRLDLADDPAVIGIASALGMDEYSVVGRLHKLWSWADRQSRDGHAASVTEKWIDRYVERDGFAAQMVKVGWLKVLGSGVSFPNFDRHNGESAKKRGLAANRQRNARVTSSSRNERDKSVTREEKRRSNPIVPSGQFLRFWGVWPKSPRKQSRGPCWERWRKADFDLTADQIITHVEAMKLSIDWRKDAGAFIPAPLVYLNQRRWDGADLSAEPQERRLAV